MRISINSPIQLPSIVAVVNHLSVHAYCQRMYKKYNLKVVNIKIMCYFCRKQKNLDYDI